MRRFYIRLDHFKLDGEWYGSKIAFDQKGYLFFTVGWRQKEKCTRFIQSTRQNYQIKKDHGSIPPDNPFIVAQEA